VKNKKQEEEGKPAFFKFSFFENDRFKVPPFGSIQEITADWKVRLIAN
jgi:hypothetical protein